MWLSCGECTGGTTGKDANNLKDQCGVCGGNGEECVDCAGVVNGKKQLDVCGECLELDDPNFNTGRLPFLHTNMSSVFCSTHLQTNSIEYSG